MLRQIMIPDQQKITINIPKEYLHHAIEILAFRLPENETKPANGMKDTLALFAKYRGSYKGNFDREEAHER
jgi:hypothetical protein